MENKKYFYGNEISSYGVEHNRVDYRTLAKSFDAVLCNDITRLFYSTINGEYNEPEIVNGSYFYYENDDGDVISESEYYDLDDEQQEQYHEYENEIFQYYIIDGGGAMLLQDLTDEIVYYIPVLDIHIWGVTHYGTSWDYVLTNIKINDMEK